jgi:hypothetical protein
VNPCQGERTIARVDHEFVTRIDGKLDRMVTVTRDCGCPYFAGGAVDGPLPEVGARAMRCPGIDPQRQLITPDQPTIFDTRTTTRHRPTRRDEVSRSPKG